MLIAVMIAFAIIVEREAAPVDGPPRPLIELTPLVCPWQKIDDPCAELHAINPRIVMNVPIELSMETLSVALPDGRLRPRLRWNS